MKIEETSDMEYAITGKKPIVFEEDVIFIPEYIYNAFNASGVTIEEYFNLLETAIANGGDTEILYLDADSEELNNNIVPKIKEYNKRLYKALGGELVIFLNLQKEVHKELNIYLKKRSTIEDLMVIGLRDAVGRSAYNNINVAPSNILSNTDDNVNFRDTYSVTDSKHCLVILKDGFGNEFKNNKNKLILLNDVLNSREMFMRDKVFSSTFMKSAIELNYKNI